MNALKTLAEAITLIAFTIAATSIASELANLLHA